MKETTKEIEVRYQLGEKQRECTLATLRQRGWTPKQSIQHDIYFCAREYKESGRTKECPYIVRIRRTDQTSILAYKSFQGGDGSFWTEVESDVGNPQAIQSILVNLKQEPYLEIKKSRLSGIIEGIEINIDSIENLGDYIEFEVRTNDENAGRQHLIAFAKQLGLPQDNAVTTGYVQLMEQRLTA